MNELKKKLQAMAGGMDKQQSATYVRTVLDGNKLVLDHVSGGGSVPAAGGSVPAKGGSSKR